MALVGASQNLWTGPAVTFTKIDFADWTLEENQDRLTTGVWITRANNQGIFNAAVEPAFDRVERTSPEGTEWAFGSIADGIENLTFTTWHLTNVEPTHQQLGVKKVLHLIEEDIYIDVTFTQWTQGGGGSGTGMGGGFSYERSTDPATGFNDLASETISIYPNPSSGVFFMKHIKRPVEYQLFNLIGVLVEEGVAAPNKAVQLDVEDGTYFLKTKTGTVMKLIIRA